MRMHTQIQIHAYSLLGEDDDDAEQTREPRDEVAQQRRERLEPALKVT